MGGDLYCENIESIKVHKYGPHIFHTKSWPIWNYMCQLCDFNNFIYSPIANYKGELFNLPFNMNTFYQLWGTKTPLEADQKIKEQCACYVHYNSDNLENYALKSMGKDIYEKLIKGYTEKQWGKKAEDLPTFILKRIPFRFTFNNNYFEDPYQGIPKDGYNVIFNQCFENCDVILNVDYLDDKSLAKLTDAIVYTGTIDTYYNYVHGELEYRSLRFETEVHNIQNYQGAAVVNYTYHKIPYTRIIEHKHFEFKDQPKTVITKEFPQLWKRGLEPFYPVNTSKNQEKIAQYKELALKEKNVFFGGRLATYEYFDMDQTVAQALKLAKKIL